MRLRLAPDWNCWPLWNDETGDLIDPRDLDLPPALLTSLLAWDDIFQAGLNLDDPPASTLPGTDWHTEGRALARELEALGFEVVVKLYD